MNSVSCFGFVALLLGFLCLVQGQVDPTTCSTVSGCLYDYTNSPLQIPTPICVDGQFVHTGYAWEATIAFPDYPTATLTNFSSTFDESFMLPNGPRCPYGELYLEYSQGTMDYSMYLCPFPAPSQKATPIWTTGIFGAGGYSQGYPTLTYAITFTCISGGRSAMSAKLMQLLGKTP